MGLRSCPVAQVVLAVKEVAYRRSRRLGVSSWREANEQLGRRLSPVGSNEEILMKAFLNSRHNLDVGAA